MIYTNGGTDIVVAQAVSANAFVGVSDASILKRVFSETAFQQLFFGAVTSFNSSSLDITVGYIQL